MGFLGLRTHLEKYQIRCKSKYIWGWRVTRVTMIGKDAELGAANLGKQLGGLRGEAS